MAKELKPGMAEPLTVELRELIKASRQRVARMVNSELVLLYWEVGRRLRSEVVGEGRAEYGKEVVAAVSRTLSAEFGRGFRKRNLHYMMRFAEVFPDLEIVHALRAQLGWTHLRHIIALEDPLQRQFYAELCRLERWSTRMLQARIAGMLYERTAIARRPEAIVEEALEALRDEGRMSPDLVFRDPYVLDFLALPAEHGERELEAAILHDLERFLTELGEGFSFVARQKRISIGPDDYYLDLLFFHRPLRALVAIELKLGRFDARDKGQMELYLRWLDRHERGPDENPPLGLILCADRNQEQIELLELDRGTLRVASYLTQLPPRELLERQLARAIERARERRGSGRDLPHKVSEGPPPVYLAVHPPNSAAELSSPP
ncbi:MAG: PDDEXK nuclease domain-containing protein [Deltaproteobacteria bacterium]|nr:PDDEXK nuclease domain-containing protein [Deltaproteobacteria bacterium]